MKQSIQGFCLVLVGQFIVVGICLAQPSMPFWNAVTRVLTTIRSASVMRAECIRLYPNYADPIDAGYAYWTKKHAGLESRILEVRNKQLREFRNEQVPYAVRVRQFDDNLDKAMTEIRVSEFASRSTKTASVCKNLATYYAMDDMDVRKVHAKDLDLILSFER